MLADEALLVPGLPGSSSKFLQIRLKRSGLGRINRDARREVGLPDLLSRRTRFTIDRSDHLVGRFLPPLRRRDWSGGAAAKHKADTRCV